MVDTGPRFLDTWNCVSGGGGLAPDIAAVDRESHSCRDLKVRPRNAISEALDISHGTVAADRGTRVMAPGFADGRNF
jgi:hypothetical protein